MEEQQFISLVNELEDFAHHKPGEYKLRVALLAALGYVFLLGTVLVMVIVVGLVAYFGRFNTLPDLARSIREATKGPRLHKILLTDEFNAAIVQRPRLGLFGWHENYLLVGLPLLRGLSVEEVRIALEKEYKPLRKIFERVEGSEIYSRRL